ncbi:DoxX family protein [Actinocrispum sp. NPDC049592]|uniref:DoxX family protein n=1 Tax=Actinocrispum sp. NPDC049592 TaxID=3154835 RepID=UPI00341EAD9B
MTTSTLRPNTVSKTAVSGATVSAFRVVVSFLFVCHALQGFGMFGGIDGAGTAVSFGMWPGWYASVLELVGGAFVLLGIHTRPAAVVCSGVMAYAYFTVHQQLALLPLQNMGEPAALYSWIFLLIAVLGPGSYTVATVLRRRK